MTGTATNWKMALSTYVRIDMNTYHPLIQQGSSLLEKSALKDLLLPLWRLIEWQGHAQNSGDTAILSRTNDAAIHLYPALLQHPEALKHVLREFGLFVLHRAGERGEALWRSKLDVPTKEQIDMAQQKLADKALRKSCSTYEAVLNAYPTSGHSVDRLVYINLVNALLANNIAYPDSEGVNLLTWGPTTEYASRKRYHSLIPLVSAYSPSDVYRCYRCALAAFLHDSLGNVRDSSVAFALRGLVQRIARIASPA